MAILKTWFGLAAVLLFPAFVSRAADSSSPPLAPVSSHVISHGVDAKLNGGFASMLGLSKDKSDLKLKRMTVAEGTATNVCDVSVQDGKTILFHVRSGSITTYFTTDVYGVLRRAVVNDSAVTNGGLTNIPISKAEANFRIQKEFWIKQTNK
jgi:hypothetical protein